VSFEPPFWGFGAVVIQGMSNQYLRNIAIAESKSEEEINEYIRSILEYE
jgi:hypothetical protein